MMYKPYLRRTFLLLLFFTSGLTSALGARVYTLTVNLTEEDTREPVIMGSLRLRPVGAIAVTDVKGNASIQNIPAGEYILDITYVGFEPIHARINVKGDMSLKYVMKPTTLKLKDVTVTAQQSAAGRSTASLIGRQAIDHLQATSLADVMQLIPGQLMGNNDLTSAQNLQLRSLVNNNTNAFGSSIVLDGVPMSNNGALSQGQFSSTTFVGTDLRRISADDIDNVEVIRGIPSAEYGDLTSGLVVVHSKVGVTPWQVKGKITPALMNFSVGKGLNVGKYGVYNFNADYAKAWGDPRNKTQTFNRYNFSLAWGYNFTRKWHGDTKIRFMQNNSGSGDDPDLKADGTESYNRTTTLSITQNGKVSLNMPLMRTLTYTAGLSLTDIKNRNTSYVSNSTGLIPILTAMETGYYDVPWLTTSYLATGITESAPGNVFLKVNDAFFLRKGKLVQSFKTGLEYKYDWNNGKGYYNVDETRPYKPNSNGRPRAFSDIPGTHQVSAYAEDAMTLNLNKVNILRMQFGLRFTSLFAGAIDDSGSATTTALSPRVNLGLDITRWMTLRMGVGMNSKMPSLDYLYPDKKYDDRVSANYISQSDTATSILNYHTQVYHVLRSEGLKNATTTKYELGTDFKLSNGGMLSVLGYYDRTPNGFGTATEYFTYTYNVYTAASGLIVTPGEATTIDYSSPENTYTVFMTTGKVGNTNTAENKGVELDMNFGEIKPLHTTVYLSGAYSETKTYSSDLNTSSPRSSLLPTSYSTLSLTPFKVVYPSGEDYSQYRRFVLTLRTVTNIPLLRMVASFTAQAVLRNYSHSYVSDKNAIGYITPDLVYHDITEAMLDGYLDFNGEYSTEVPDGYYIKISDLATSESSAVPIEAARTWNLQGRLSKDLGDFGGLSLYVNNMLFYEPFKHNSNTTSLTQRNTGTWTYGIELHVNL